MFKLIKSKEYNDLVETNKELVSLNKKLEEKLKESEVKSSELESQVFSLVSDIQDLKNSKAVRFYNKVIPLDTGDPLPTDSEKYRSFVGEAAGSYKNIWKPKLKQMIASAFALLESAENEFKVDQAIKGAIYAFREIMNWGEDMINKQVALQNENSEEEEN